MIDGVFAIQPGTDLTTKNPQAGRPDIRRQIYVGQSLLHVPISGRGIGLTTGGGQTANGDPGICRHLFNSRPFVCARPRFHTVLVIAGGAGLDAGIPEVPRQIQDFPKGKLGARGAHKCVL